MAADITNVSLVDRGMVVTGGSSGGGAGDYNMTSSYGVLPCFKLTSNN